MEKYELNILVEKLTCKNLPKSSEFQSALDELSRQVDIRNGQLSKEMRIIVNRDVERISLFLQGWLSGLEMCGEITPAEYQTYYKNLAAITSEFQ